MPGPTRERPHPPAVVLRRVAVVAALASMAACARDTATPTVEPPSSSSPVLLLAPADPLEGLDEKERLSWGLARLPALARPDRAPAPDFARFGGAGSTVEFFSPDFAEHVGLAHVYEPCETIELAVQAEGLVTRIPTAGGAAWPKASGAHLVLKLDRVMRLGGGTGPAPLLSELSDSILRYEGTPAVWTVVCAGEGKILRTCGDGTSDECAMCEPALVPELSPPVPAPTRHHPEKGPCPPCPADDHGPNRVPLARVAAEQPFLTMDPATGPVFYRAREACDAVKKPSKKKVKKKKKKPPPQKKKKKKKKIVLTPAPKGRTHGVPLHPGIVLLCDQVVERGSGGHDAASVYESTLEPAVLTRWFGRATGVDPQAEGAWMVLRLAGKTIEIAKPEAFEAALCGDPSAASLTLVRVSTPF